MFRIATAACYCCAPCSGSFLSCTSCSPTKPMRGRSSMTALPRRCQASRSTSSSAASRPRGSSSKLNAGSSSGRSYGSADAAAWLAIGRSAITARPRSFASSPPASCYESSVILHEVLGRALTSAPGGHLPASVICKNVIAGFYDCVASEAALRIIRLRWCVIRCARSERVGCSVMLEHSPSPPAAVGESLAVLRHKIHVVLSAGHGGCGEGLQICWIPMDFGHLRTVRERLSIPGDASPIGVDHHRIGDDRREQVSIVADRDKLPALVAPEL